ncbi:MAG: type II toxin-antitoxin system prevent-host-death family antitoxin [Candidatus Methanomethylicaceae archaeon]
MKKCLSDCFTKLLRAVKHGEEIVITRRGVLIAMIVPYETAQAMRRKLAYLRTVELSAKLQDVGVDAQTLAKEARADLGV